MRQLTELFAVMASRVSLIFLLLAVASGCTKGNDATPSEPAIVPFDLPSSPWPKAYVLPTILPGPLSKQLGEADVSRLTIQAYAGDPASAWLLRQYYASFTPTPSETVSDWELLAAENGDKSGASFYAARLEALGGEQNCLRAKFWYERAFAYSMSSGAAEDVSIRANLESLAQNWQMCLNRGRPK